MARKITTEIFVSEMKNKYGDKFNYDKVVYVDASKTKITVTCPKHGDFDILPSNLRAGYGCPKCSEEQITEKNKQDFLKKAHEKFGDTFDYSKMEYKTKKSKVTIICPIHGEIEMIAENHLSSKTGCPKCSYHSPRKAVVVEGKNRKELREYRIWRGMKTRVTNPNIADSDRYFYRDIICCEEWLNSFEQFYKDMGPCPEGYSIDRIDNSKGYYPENCRWASAKTQCENRGDFNKVFTYNGESHVLKEWARIFNNNYTTLYTRIFRSGLSFEDAIKEDPYNRLIELNGEKKILKDWCEVYNIPYGTVINRLHKHKWTMEEALLTPYKHKKIKIESKI